MFAERGSWQPVKKHNISIVNSLAQKVVSPATFYCCPSLHERCNDRGKKRVFVDNHCEEFSRMKINSKRRIVRD